MADSFHRFSGEYPEARGCTKSWFAEDLCTGKLDGEAGEACVLRCVYLFICLLFVCLFFVCVFAF